MIARLKGEVVLTEPGKLVIDVGGVGYEVLMPARDQPVGIATLFVHTDVREDAIVLYGFLSIDDKEIFQKLRTVDGVGPKVALSALSHLTVAQLVAAINTGDTKTLIGIPSVGKKLADRLILELKGKLFAAAHPTGATAAQTKADDSFALAMAQLGYKKSEIDAVAARLAEQGLADDALPARITAALSMLARGR